MEKGGEMEEEDSPADADSDVAGTGADVVKKLHSDAVADAWDAS